MTLKPIATYSIQIKRTAPTTSETHARSRGIYPADVGRLREWMHESVDEFCDAIGLPHISDEAQQAMKAMDAARLKEMLTGGDA